MNHHIICLGSLSFPFLLAAQNIETRAPDTVIKDAAFQVQYIIKAPAEEFKVIPPAFNGLKLLQGPTFNRAGVHKGQGGKESIEYIRFTLVPVVTGIIKLEGLSLHFKTRSAVRSQDLFFHAIDPPKASYLARSTLTDFSLFEAGKKFSLAKVLADNIFIKTEVSKISLYKGESVVVRFKLFSSLQSYSQAIKSPGLYGFSVVDMLDINQAHTGVEKIGKKIFNTAILRQMQLYPISTGALVVDPMHLKNTIEFNSPHSLGHSVVVSELASDSTAVFVRPLPAGAPENFNGAVGAFSLSVHLKENLIKSNQQNALIISLKGRGNFLQFGITPPVEPPGISFNEITVKDNINKNLVPESGVRIYEISFTAEKVGCLPIAPVKFSFFNPQHGKYETVKSDTLFLRVIAGGPLGQPPRLKRDQAHLIPWWFYGLLILILAGFSFKMAKRQPKIKTRKYSGAPAKKLDYRSELEDLYKRPEKEFYEGLEKILSAYRLSHQDHLSLMEKEGIEKILKECQFLVYAPISVGGKKQALKNSAAEIFEKNV